MPLHIATTVPLSALKRPLEDLYEAAKNSVRRKLKLALAEARVKEIHKAITAVQKVKTMWRIEKEVKLLTFYYPSRVLIEKTPKPINSIAEISETERFVLQGTVGQGKSIFLRYLCIKELSIARRIPIFLELRRYDPKQSFRNFLVSSIGVYRIPCDEDVFDFLAESGKLVLLLDGFDEVDPDTVTHVVAELESLAQKYPRLQIVVTSRPDSGIERSPHFRVYRLAPLTSADHKPFLEKIVEHTAKVKEILAAIQRSTQEISSLLTTPLLMTLLVLIYNATQEIPASLSEFYGALFQTLLTRHDHAKPGFRRKRASPLSDADLRRLFEVFSYAARQQNQLVLTEENATDLLRRASTVTNISCDPDAFLSDISKVACLMQQEGFDYHFIHKSVAEFHAACFIAHASEENAQRFYAGVLSGKWMNWGQELVFLAQIDRSRYLKHFLVPSTLQGLQALGIDPDSSGEISDEHALRLLNKIVLHMGPRNEQAGIRARNVMSFQLTETPGFVVHKLQMDMLHLALPAPPLPNELGDKIGLGDYLAVANKLTTSGYKKARQAVQSARDALKRARADLELDTRVGDFVAP